MVGKEGKQILYQGLQKEANTANTLILLTESYAQLLTTELWGNALLLFSYC